MRKSTRIFVLLLVIEVLLVLGSVYMVGQVSGGNWNAPDHQEAISRIMTVIGAAIPLVALPFLLIGIGLRRKGE
ncbi:hypothetical protein [Devosia aurantiaca]|uniref:Uncharacterized protein n=1 Tax=Devosia aurantiaca TaxID=2714858 RepID=A0A6M1SWI8_9HYPH|nr:hypothetical protein [Devosia aurantiaca]NGP19375.1 hypothetical protein [Devosia aurantiaca]